MKCFTLDKIYISKHISIFLSIIRSCALVLCVSLASEFFGLLQSSKHTHICREKFIQMATFASRVAHLSLSSAMRANMKKAEVLEKKANTQALAAAAAHANLVSFQIMNTLQLKMQLGERSGFLLVEPFPELQKGIINKLDEACKAFDFYSDVLVEKTKAVARRRPCVIETSPRWDNDGGLYISWSAYFLDDIVDKSAPSAKPKNISDKKSTQAKLKHAEAAAAQDAAAVLQKEAEAQQAKAKCKAEDKDSEFKSAIGSPYVLA